MTVKEKNKDFNWILKESLRTRTRTSFDSRCTSRTIFNDADIAHDDVVAVYLADVSVTYNETFQLSVELLLQTAKLQVFHVVYESRDKDDEDDSDHDDDAFNGARCPLCRIRYSTETKQGWRFIVVIIDTAASICLKVSKGPGPGLLKECLELHNFSPPPPLLPHFSLPLSFPSHRNEIWWHIYKFTNS